MGFLVVKNTKLLTAEGAEKNSEQRHSRDYSTIARTSPAFTAAPSVTRIFWTVPFFGDLISFCIFIASTTRTPAPASTSAPWLTRTRTTLPGMGAVIFLGP